MRAIVVPVVAIREDRTVLITEPLPARRLRPRTDMHWRELQRLDREVAMRAVINRAKTARLLGVRT